MEQWVGKVAIVTGASSGIGAAIVEKLVEEGLKVIGLARRKERLNALANNLLNKKGQFYPYPADITQEQEVLNAFAWVKDNVGLVHVLVNNAGLMKTHLITELKTEDIKAILNVNILGMLIATRETMKIMNENDINGHIININSIAGHSILDYPGISVYTSSKFAVTALTKSLQNEIKKAKRGTKVTSISPGPVKTEMIVDQDVSELIKNNPEFCALEAKDVADAAVYVLSTLPHCQVDELTITPILIKK